MSYGIDAQSEVAAGSGVGADIGAGVGVGGGGLAATGPTITVFGTVLGQFQLTLIAVGLVLVGALLVKFGFRRGKTPADV